jgi:hypothetical protein
MMGKKTKLPHLIVLINNKKTHEPPSAECTCGWTFGPSEVLMTLGKQAIKHHHETGHGLRKHV